MTNKRRHGVLLGFSALAVLVAGVPAAAAPAAHATQSNQQAVMDLVKQTNDARRAAGCSPVALDEELRAVAQEHATELSRDGHLEHANREGESSGDRITSAGYEESYGENLAHGYPTAAEVLRVWMGSAGHRENIENCAFTAIGVGYEPHGHYWVQDFAS